MIAAPAAWAVGWTVVGYAGIHLNQQIGLDVGTSSAVYSSSMRLYVTAHSPCGESETGSPNFWFKYVYPSGQIYQWVGPFQICTAAQTPTYFNVAGGNKFAICGEYGPEHTDPASTCQRYSTT